MLRKLMVIAVCCVWANLGHAEMTTLKTAYGTQFNAYVVGPDDATSGVVLAHDRWGMSDEIKKWADRLARDGHLVVVADLYDGRPIRDELMTREVMAQTDPEWARANLNGALSFLKSGSHRVAVVGWGYGAGFLYQIAAERGAEIDALVAFYALPSGKQFDLSGIEVPMLGVFGRRDKILDVARVDDFQHQMLKLRKSLEVVTVEASSGFVNPLNDSYRAGISTRAWLATQSFLARHIAGE